MNHHYFRARIRLLGTEEGGRRTPVLSGYRPMLNFEPSQSNRFNDGILTLVACDMLDPGEFCDADIELLCPELVPVELKPGVPFNMNEGSIVVATGEVLEVYTWLSPGQRL
jgi:elongation factor Tu